MNAHSFMVWMATKFTVLGAWISEAPSFGRIRNNMQALESLTEQAMRARNVAHLECLMDEFMQLARRTQGIARRKPTMLKILGRIQLFNQVFEERLGLLRFPVMTIRNPFYDETPASPPAGSRLH